VVGTRFSGVVRLVNDPIGAPITLERVVRCRESADFWADELGIYAGEIRARADLWSWVSVGCSALTGLGVWTTLAASTAWPAVLALSVVAFVAAVAGAAPKVGQYEETAKTAAALAPRYGQAIGQLKDLEAALTRDPLGDETQAAARAVVASFEAIKRDKDALSPRSRRLRKQLRRLEERRESDRGKAESDRGKADAAA